MGVRQAWVAATVTVLLLGCAQPTAVPQAPTATPSPMPTPGPETTVDIGAVVDTAMGNRLTPATFVTRLSASDGTALAIRYLQERHGWDAVALGLPIHTTVGLWTGIREETGVPSGRQVVDLRVRVVVFENVPAAFSGGPATPTPMPRAAPAPATPIRWVTRCSMFLDDATGNVVWATVTKSPA